MLRILVADDYEIVRRGLKQILLEEFSVIHLEEACDVATLTDKAITKNWDMIITDITMPDGNGLEALARIRNHKPSLPVLVISIYPEEQYGPHVLLAGADGYISKNSVPEKLIQAVKHILSGKKYNGHEFIRMPEQNNLI